MADIKRRTLLRSGAGVAAAQSIHDDCELADVAIERVQAELIRQGVRIH